MRDEARGWLFACPDDVIDELNLDWADAPRRISHNLGVKKPRPAVSDKQQPDAFGPEVWDHILGLLPVVPKGMTFVRANTYGSARLFRMDGGAADYLASWTPDTVDEWSDAMKAIALQVVEDFAEHPSWQPTAGGAVGALLRARDCALLARSRDARAQVYHYWYARPNLIDPGPVGRVD